MGSQELPDTKAKPMDEDHLAKLIHEAMVAFNDFLSEHTFPTEVVNVLRSDGPGSSSSHSLTRPKLWNALFDYQAEHMDIPAAKALTDYLWGHGGHRITLTKDNGDPNRTDWAGNAFHMVVVNSLYSLWDKHSIRSLSATGLWQPWKLPYEEVNQLAKDMAAIEVGKGAKIKITIPLLQLALADKKSVELETGVTLREWTQEDKASYLHKNQRVYPFDDAHGPHISDCYLEMVVNESQIFKDGMNHCVNKQEILADFVGPIVGRIKWAIMQVTNSTQLIRELPATTEIWHSVWGFFPIRRQGMGLGSGGKTNLDVGNCQSVVKLLKMLKEAQKVYPDLDDVVWMFDRATLAVLPRDILLESAIGLERLLVHGNGENTRRFKTYGAALIGGDAPMETAKRLGEIYSKRSCAAHGSDKKSDNKAEKLEKLSATARADLGMALANVVRLVVSSKINPERNGKDIAEAIEHYQTSKIYVAMQKDLADC